MAKGHSEKRVRKWRDLPASSLGDPASRPGAQIGSYKLLRTLGEGGFGVIYLAQQKGPVKRQVALKVIKPGMDTKQVIARFEAERQALAMFDHPNIAHVFDAGTTPAGHPYFVMEYIKGIPITEHCDGYKLSVEDRLRLFSEVCDGIQHAHQKGIIHRDMKPSNILVSIHGEKPVPVIIDFGVAKALGQPLTERTLFTGEGQLIGTPEYMSPEQANLTSQDVDTCSDIYSMGVVLYELLTGALPFDRRTLEREGLAGIQRIIREEDPPRPSARLLSLGEEAVTIAKSRRTDVKRLARLLHKELEYIPLKAMRKERTRRYRTAAEFADDIQNYLNGNPLTAGPESGVYRFKKFVRRHRTPVISTVLVMVSLLVWSVVSTTMHFRAERTQRIKYEIEGAVIAGIPDDVELILEKYFSTDRHYIYYIVRWAAGKNVAHTPAKLPPHFITPLLLAASLNRKDMTEILLERGAEVNAKDSLGRTALHVAVSRRHSEVAELLLTEGADANVKDVEHGWAPLHAAAYNGDSKTAESLIANGADLSVKDAKMGRTPLHVAAANGDSKMTELLIANGARLNAKDDSDGATPLHEAAVWGHKEVVELLLARGAAVNARTDSGWTPVHLAWRYKEVVDLLVKHGGR
jgi:serine/threonine protein kinase